MSKRRPSQKVTPPPIKERSAPVGEREGDNPLPPGVRRRDKQLPSEEMRRRGDPDGVEFERKPIEFDETGVKGESSGGATSVSGTSALRPSRRSDDAKTPDRLEPAGPVEMPDGDVEPVAQPSFERSLPPLSGPAQPAAQKRGFQEFWLHRFIPAKAMFVVVVLIHVLVAALLYMVIA